MTRDPRLAVLPIVLATALPQPAAAQSTAAAPRPSAVVEGTLGWAGFGDEGIIHHGLAGASTRLYVTRRLSLGPEVTYMAGPGSDRDLMVTGNVMVDLLAPRRAQPRRTTPFFVAGGGLFRHSDRFVNETFSSTEGGVTVGIGVRTWLTPRTFMAVDVRLGWEPHLRVAATVGVNLNPH